MNGALSKSLHDKVVAFEKLKQTAPIVIGNMALNFFRSSFENQGFTDNALMKWPEVQRRIPGTPEYKYPKKNAGDRHGRGILIGLRTKGNGPHLRDSVNTSLKQTTWESILFTVPQPYAAIHNYGLTMKNGDKMPQRQFMGNSVTLINMITAYMIKQGATIRNI